MKVDSLHKQTDSLKKKKKNQFYVDNYDEDDDNEKSGKSPLVLIFKKVGIGGNDLCRTTAKIS